MYIYIYSTGYYCVSVDYAQTRPIYDSHVSIFPWTVTYDVIRVNFPMDWNKNTTALQKHFEKMHALSVCGQCLSGPTCLSGSTARIWPFDFRSLLKSETRDPNTYSGVDQIGSPA